MITTTTTKHLSETDWHSLSITEVLQPLESNLETGLTTIEVDQQRTCFEANGLVGQIKRNAWMRFLLQLNQPILYLTVDESGLTGESVPVEKWLQLYKLV